MNFMENPNVLNIYHYGSYVYQTYNKNTSDYDFLIIIKDTYSPQISNVIIDNLEEPVNVEEIMLDKAYTNCQLNFIRISDWEQMIKDNHVEALEIFWLDEKFVIKETVHFEISINYDKVRENISKTASNSFVKCKKKLELTTDFRIGKKSLWHSLRLLMFGNQIMQFGKIIDYTIANNYYDDIVKNEINEWGYYKKKYQPIYNGLKTQFKINHQIVKNS